MNSQQPFPSQLSSDLAGAAESLSVATHKERTSYKSSDYNYLHPMQDTVITVEDRSKLVDWCYGVVDKCELDRETVAMTMEIVDRFLSKPSTVAYTALQDRGHFQLVAMASLYTTIKVHTNVAFGSDIFAALSQGAYSVDDIESMEINILEGLSWRICAPTSIQVAYNILSLTLPRVNLHESTWVFILDEVHFQCENAVRDYYFTTRRPSTVALASIFNVLGQLGCEDRQAMFHALLVIINEDFDSPKDLIDARHRLIVLLKDGDAIDDESTLDSVTASRDDASCSTGVFPGCGSFDDQRSCSSPSTSLSCSRQEYIPCVSCTECSIKH